jgi:hypothetical protein
MLNKKASLVSLPTKLVLGFVGIVILTLCFILSANLRMTIIGIGFIVGGFIMMGMVFSSNRTLNNKLIALILIPFMIGGLMIALPYTGFLSQTTFSGFLKQEVFGTAPGPIIAFPNMGGIKCDVVDSAIGVERTITKSGMYFCDTCQGFYTPSLTNVKIRVDYNWWQALTKTIRFRVKTCDIQTKSCSEKITKYAWPDSNNGKMLILNSIDLTRNTVSIYFEKCNTVSVCGLLDTIGWVPDTNAYISYDADKYGLVLYSTLRNPAGETICSDSCELNCPEQGYRDYMLNTTKYSLLPRESVSYLQYWDTVNYDINSQGGATAYNKNTNTFCLGGKIYSTGQVTYEETGNSYIYPDTYLRTEKCCPGANIAITNGYKICQSDYSWKEITNNSISLIQCISDINCPGGGLKTCSLLNNKYYTSGTYCGTDKKCHQKSFTEVDCCPPSLGCDRDMSCNDNNKCVGGTIDIPINPAGNDSVNDTNPQVCSFGYESYSTTKQQCKILGMFWCEDKPYTGCKISGIVYTIVILVFIGMMIVVIVLLLKDKQKKRYKRRKK